jgi:hypothetical protein
MSAMQLPVVTGDINVSFMNNSDQRNVIQLKVQTGSTKTK